MKNFLRTRTSMPSDTKKLKKIDCDHNTPNGLSINCELLENRENSNDNQEWTSNTNNNFNDNPIQNYSKQKSSLFNTIKLSPHLNTLLPQFQTVEKRSYGETFYKSLAINKRPRLVKKCGELNIHMENVAKHKRRLFKDLFNTVIGIA